MEQCDAIITLSERLTPSIVRLSMHAPTVVAQAKPGQFINLRAGLGHDPLLRRPLSIHQTHRDGTLQVVFKIIGKGTMLLADLRPGNSVNLLGPLGNSFKIGDTMCLVGGGLGIAPLLFLAKFILAHSPGTHLEVIIGGKNREELSCFERDFSVLGIQAHLATDDGSMGHHGLVTELIPTVLTADKNWLVCTCGPHPMMRNVAALCLQRHWSCQVSLETMMACGISACLGCAIEASPTHSAGAKYLHVCQDGPIFSAGDIKW